MTFTAAQLRALEWLPSDGSWRDAPGKLSQGLDSLWLMFYTKHGESKFCEYEFGRKYGTNGGEGRRWRLTDAGMEAKKELEATK